MVSDGPMKIGNCDVKSAMFLICAFNREHDLQIYSKAQWLQPFAPAYIDFVVLYRLCCSPYLTLFFTQKYAACLQAQSGTTLVCVVQCGVVWAVHNYILNKLTLNIRDQCSLGIIVPQWVLMRCLKWLNFHQNLTRYQNLAWLRLFGPISSLLVR